MVRSHTPASSHAWPTAWPRTAAMTGLGKDHIFICTSNPLGAGSSSGYSDAYRSPPAEKARPAPVSITALTSSSDSARSSAANSSRCTFLFMAFRIVGRFSTTRANTSSFW